MAVKDGSPGDVKLRSFFQVACDETSCIACWWRGSWNSGEGWNSWTNSPSNDGKKDEQEAIVLPSNKKEKEKARRLNKFPARSQGACGIVSSQGDGILEVYKFDFEGCPNKNLQFISTQLILEVVRDVEVGRTKAICCYCTEKERRPLGVKHRPAVQGLGKLESFNGWK